MNNSAALINNITDLLNEQNIDFQTKRFGGFEYFMSNGKVICSVFGDKLLVKCLPDNLNEILKNELAGTVPDPSGNPQKDMFTLSPEAIDSTEKLKNWLSFGIEYSKTK